MSKANEYGSKANELGMGMRNDFQMVSSSAILLPKDLKGRPCIERAYKRGRKCVCKIGTNRYPFNISECNDSYCPVHNPQEEPRVQMSSRPGTLEFEPKTRPFDETVNENVKGIFNSLKHGAQKAKNYVSRVVNPKQPPKEQAVESKIFNVDTMTYRLPQNVQRQTRRNISLQTLEKQEEQRNNRGANAQLLPNRQSSQSSNQNNRKVSLSLRGGPRQKLSRKAIRSAQKSTKRGAKGKKKQHKPEKSNKKKNQKPKKTKKKKKKKGKK